jgi:hypothetical protein
MVLQHFVINPYCPKIDYEKLASDLFADQRCLMVLEKKPAWHVHVQGELAEGVNIDAALKELAEKHSKREIDPTCRPVKKRKLEADEIGFQYMAKQDGSEVLYSNGFDDEELTELKRLSDLRRQEVKQSMSHYIEEELSNSSFTSCETMHDAFRLKGLDFYLSEDKLPPPNFQKLVLWAMIKSKHCSGATKVYVSQRI